MTTCPVRELTPEVVDVLRWFNRTHDVEVLGMGSAFYRLVRYPRAGGLEDQDAWLLDALDFCRAEKNALLGEQRTREAMRRDLREFHDEVHGRRAQVH